MREGAEWRALESIDIDRMHKKALEAIERSRISEIDFATSVYSADEVKDDLLHVKKLEDQFDKSSELKKIADIFEAIFLEQAELSNWLGESAHTIKTSRFDDYVNGVDAIVEFDSDNPENAYHLGVAADVTFTTDTTKKFDKLIGKIERGELPQVKYFEPEHSMPEVIIGAHKNTVLELAELWMERKNKAMAVHRIQIMILEQMRAQLEVFAEYAKNIGKEDLALAYEERLVIVDKLLEDKAAIQKQDKYEIMNDPVHVEIMDFVSRWKR